MTNSIIAGNELDMAIPNDIDGDLVDLDVAYSLIGVKPAIVSGTGLISGTVAAPYDPMLGALDYNGGQTRTHALIAGSAAMGRPELLAGGIGSALLSTAAGLSVAIPALILYLWFVGRVDGLVMEIDRLGQDLVHLISAEAVDERRSRGGRSARSNKSAA